VKVRSEIPAGHKFSQPVGSYVRLGAADGTGDGPAVGDEHMKKSGPHEAHFSGWEQNEPAGMTASHAAHEAPKPQQKFPSVGAYVADGALLGVRLGALETPWQKNEAGVHDTQFSSRLQNEPGSNCWRQLAHESPSRQQKLEGVGARVGSGVGASVGLFLGSSVGSAVGLGESPCVSPFVWPGVATGVGRTVGSGEYPRVWPGVATGVGLTVGSGECSRVWPGVGDGVGLTVGTGVGS